MPSEKTMLCILRGSRSAWNRRPFFCHHIVIFLFSSKGSPGSAGRDRRSAEQCPQPTLPSQAHFKQRLSERGRCRARLFWQGIDFYPFPQKPFLSPYIWKNYSYSQWKTKRSSKKLFQRGWGDTWEEKHQKKTSEVFSIKNGLGSSMLGTVIRERETGGGWGMVIFF